MNKILLFFFLLLVTLSCSRKVVQYNDPIPEHETMTIESMILNEARVMNIWLPPNYDKTDSSFPVMYMPDGGVKEDFPHIANTIAKLVENKSIPPIILVGIENTDRRRDLTGPTEVDKDREINPVVGESANFRAFIKDELMPEIDGKYKTNDKNGIIGESAAGLFVVETLQLDPAMFDYYIAMDPSIWWNDQHASKNASSYMKNLPSSDIRFWFAGSNVQRRTPFISDLSKVLESEAPSTLKWLYQDEPKEKHSTIYRATKEKALIWTLGEN